MGESMRDPELSPDAVKLQRKLIHDVDGLAQAVEAKDVIKMAFLLRDWTAAYTPYPQRELLINHGGREVVELLAAMENGEGGLWCGGVATVFTYVLNAFQIPACVFMYGSGDVSHATTVFGQTVGGGRTYNYYILDAYLCFHYEWCSGELMSLTDLLRNVRTRQYGLVHRKDQRVERNLVTSTRTAEWYPWLFDNRPPPAEPTAIRSGHKIYAGATHSVPKLIASGGFREAVDEVRGDQDINEFLLDLMLVKPQFMPLVMFAQAYPEVTLLRSVIDALVEEPAWTK